MSAVPPLLRASLEYSKAMNVPVVRTSRCQSPRLAPGGTLDILSDWADAMSLHPRAAQNRAVSLSRPRSLFQRIAGRALIRRLQSHSVYAERSSLTPRTAQRRGSESGLFAPAEHIRETRKKYDVPGMVASPVLSHCSPAKVAVHSAPAGC